MLDVCVVNVPKTDKPSQMFTKEQYAQFASVLSPMDILNYIASHEEEYQNFLEQGMKAKECEVQE